MLVLLSRTKIMGKRNIDDHKVTKLIISSFKKMGTNRQTDRQIFY